MNSPVIQSGQQAPKTATASLYLGISSLVVLVASVVLGFLVESIGIISFLGVVSLLAIAAVICGFLARNRIATEKLPGKHAATSGLILGCITLFLTILLRFAIFLFFIPWLGS